MCDLCCFVSHHSYCSYLYLSFPYLSLNLFNHLVSFLINNLLFNFPSNKQKTYFLTCYFFTITYFLILKNVNQFRRWVDILFRIHGIKKCFYKIKNLRFLSITNIMIQIHKNWLKKILLLPKRIDWHWKEIAYKKRNWELCVIVSFRMNGVKISIEKRRYQRY